MRGIEARTALVTGGGGAIGRAISRRLADAGGRVGVFDQDLAAARATAEAIRGAGGNAQAYEADITERAAVEVGVEKLEAELGPVEILVNNAGWDRAMPFLETTPELWDQIISINLIGHLHLHHVVAPRMMERGGGRIVNIASDAGRVGSSGEAVYAACKGGLIAFTKTLARELASKQITVNAVAPGPTDTPLFEAFAGEKLRAALERAIPFRRLGQPEDVAGIVVFLASSEAAFITGQVISVSGGLTMHG